jgi:Endonuclease/Exonuclease/phosphatase family
MLKVLTAVLGALVLAPAALAAPPQADVRFATFNASLNRSAAGQLVGHLSTTTNVQARNAAETLQRVRPDVVLINEFDYDAAGDALRLFQDNYLSVSQNGAAPIHYPHRYAAESNTGIPTGLDVDNSGAVGGGNDAYGFGAYPGQFGMAVYSMYPIDPTGIRTFQTFLWRDMPGAKLPDDPRTPAPADWYKPAVLDVFRLSSKSHWDLPVVIGGKAVHFLTSHPTPPVFDDPPFYPAGVDFNGRRNFDEIRLWADYISPAKSGYIYDDGGGTGGLKPGSLFVIAGDQNSDPLDGDSIPGSIQQLLEHPLVNTKLTPSSPGAVEQNALQGGANLAHRSDPQFDTADFADTAPGNLRADYVLPRKSMQLVGAGVFWPLAADPLFRLVGTFPFPTSDHRLVWIDATVPSR